MKLLDAKIDPGLLVAGFALGVIYAVGVYDVLVLFGFLNARTVSHYLQEWSQATPFVPFSVGLIVGHLFFGVK